MANQRNFATATEKELHLYADGTSGSDSNDGRSAATPKKTLQAVFDLVPDIVKHNTCVHLSGTFDEPGQTYFHREISYGANLVVTGEDDYTTVAGPYTLTGSTTSLLTVAAAGWSADQHAAYFVRVLDGAGAGQVITVQGNDATTITPTKYFTVDPGIGAQIDVVQPKTVVQASSAIGRINLFCSGGGQVWLQKLSFLGSKADCHPQQCDAYSTNLTHLCFAGTVGNPLYVSRAMNVWCIDIGVDPTTFGYLTTKAGVGIRQGNPRFMHSNVSLRPLVSLGGCQAAWSSFANLAFGSRLPGSSFDHCDNTGPAGSQIKNSSGYATTKFAGAAGTGLAIAGCTSLAILSGDFGSNGSHGIVAECSYLDLQGAIAGTGNAGAGVYAHSGSVVHIKNGSPPTLTGTIGDLSTDGTTQKSTWAAIEAGTPVSDTAEMVMAKKVA